MKVLFISSGNSGKISPIIEAQAHSLVAKGIEVDFFLITEKGILGYLKSIRKLRKKRKEFSYDLFHAHYSFCGFIATFSGCRPLIVSLMGCDVNTAKFSMPVIKFFVAFFWQVTIVKSNAMKEKLKTNSIKIIPNGVDTGHFVPMDKEDCMNQLNWDKNKTHILFASDPDRIEKNFDLAKKAVKLLEKKSIEIHFLKDISFSKVPVYFNASDIVLLTSLREGSPNVIKEAMSCNRPIVSTNVGDVAQVISDLKGAYISGFKEEEVKEKIEKAILYSQSERTTDGRKKIFELELDSTYVSILLIKIYQKVIV
jgi:teichuronic acid biosynthesis glycosyltransferase TuaC